MRKRIFEIIEIAEDGDKISTAYDIIMFIAIIVSLIPLVFREDYPIFSITDKITVILFIIDYVLRFITADLKLKKGKKSYIIYPFTFWAIIDMLSIIPGLLAFNNAFKLFKLFRITRFFKIFRVFKVLRYSRSFYRIRQVIKKSKRALIAVSALAIIYILISALVIFNAEPETFGTFFDAVYWATISLTTVGYGDIYAVSTIGKIITMISAIMGIAVVALPAGVITAGYTQVLAEEKNNSENGEQPRP